MENDQPPQKRRSSSSSSKRRRKRRPPPPPKNKWLVPGMIAGGALILLLVGGLFIKSEYFPSDPEKAAAKGSGRIAADIREYYEGDYVLISPSTLVENNILPHGITEDTATNSLRSEWGEVLVMGVNAEGRTQPPYTHFLITYDNIPSSVCTNFIPTLLGRYERVWIGQDNRLPTPEGLVGSQSEIQARCSAQETVSILALSK